MIQNTEFISFFFTEFIYFSHRIYIYYYIFPLYFSISTVFLNFVCPYGTVDNSISSRERSVYCR